MGGAIGFLWISKSILGLDSHFNAIDTYFFDHSLVQSGQQNSCRINGSLLSLGLLRDRIELQDLGDELSPS